jgi:predicted Zn-dependent protease
VGFVALNIETVPVTGRKRFNWVGPEYEQQLGQAQYKQILQEFGRQILPEYDPRTRLVQKVLDRLIPHSGLEGEKWEVHVIDDQNQMNAFVIPG